MSKSFVTKFNIRPAVWPDYNPNDAVDRLTYVDTTQQISRMMQAGANLRMRNAQGLSGEDFNAPSTPIYAPDVCEAQKMINEYKDNLKRNAEELTAAYEAAKEASANEELPPAPTGAD